MSNTSISPRIMDAVSRLVCFASTGVLVLGFSGCNRSDRLPTAPVRGKVTLDGEPLSAGNVIFTPANGRTATGKIAADGSFRLGTYDIADGAVVGKHRVAVQARPKLESESEGAPLVPRFGKSPIPTAYESEDTSGLEFEVEDKVNEIDIKLSSSGPGKSPR